MMQFIWQPSPNHNERLSPEGEVIKPDMVMMHYTGMETGEAALQRLCDPDAGVSAHYLVMEDGQIYQLVDEAKRAWHAGVSYWQGITDNNARSIGIEIVNPGHEFGYCEFPKEQIDAVIDLTKGIMMRHKIHSNCVVGHSDVAPDRKQDPGELFPWQRLADEGIGQFPIPQDNDDQAFTLLKADNNVVSALNSYGYGPLDRMLTDESFLKDVITAFQRRFDPTNITGQWNSSCQRLLSSLLG